MPLLGFQRSRRPSSSFLPFRVSRDSVREPGRAMKSIPVPTPHVRLVAHCRRFIRSAVRQPCHCPISREPSTCFMTRPNTELSTWPYSTVPFFPVPNMGEPIFHPDPYLLLARGNAAAPLRHLLSGCLSRLTDSEKLMLALFKNLNAALSIARTRRDGVTVPTGYRIRRKFRK